MTDAVTNVEIEDVLSSIRRLVSENGRHPAASSKPVLSEVETAQVPSDPTPEIECEDRLVLTPALRVEGEESPDVSADPESASQADSIMQHWASDTDTPEHAPVSLGDEDLGLETVAQLGDSDLARDNLDEIAAQAAWSDDAEEAAAEAPRPSLSEVSSESGAPQAADLEGVPHEIDSRILRWSAVAHGEDTVLEPDSPGDSDYAGTDVEPLAWQDTSGATSFGGRSSDETAPEADLASLAGRIEVEAQEFVAETIESSIVPDTETIADDDETYIDEAMLRELVSDIVRQELQGALGERITRNVRKLVRREIHRALAAHELD